MTQEDYKDHPITPPPKQAQFHEFPGRGFKSWAPVSVQCPKHGLVDNVIRSDIPGHKGFWCQLCWLESLGAPLPAFDDNGEPLELSDSDD